MNKILTCGLISALFVLCAPQSQALVKYDTYDRFGNKTGYVRSVFPGIVSKYDNNGRKIGTYVSRQNGYNGYRGYNTYNSYNGRYNARYNSRYYGRGYNGGFGALQSYDRFGRRIR